MKMNSDIIIDSGDERLSQKEIEKTDGLLIGIIKKRSLWTPEVSNTENFGDLSGFTNNIDSKTSIGVCKLIFKILKSKSQFLGINQNHILGILANILEESRFNPHAYNPNDNGSPSAGLCQWHKERITNFRNKYGKELQNSSVEEQIDYLIYEITSYEKNALLKLRATNSASDAAYAWAAYFERCAIQYREGRRQNVQKVVDMLKA